MTEAEYVELARMELVDGMDGCSQSIDEQIPVWWTLNSYGFACSNMEMRYLLTKREGLKALIACYSSQINTMDTHRAQNANTKSTSRNDYSTQSQNTSAQSARSDAIGQSRYGELTNGSMDAKNERHASSWSFDDEYRSYTDKSNGATTTKANNGSKGYSSSVGESTSSGAGATSGVGSRNGCEYTYSRKQDDGRAVASTVIIATAAIGLDVSGSSWIHKMNRNEFFKQGESYKNGRKSRDAKSARDNNFRNKDTSSFFDTLIDSINRGASNSRSDDETHGFRDERLHGAGYGQGVSNSNAEGTGAAQGTSSMREDGDSKTVGSGGGYSTMNIVKAAQRAAHIQTQYNQNEMAIMRLEKIISRGYMPSLGLRNQKICNSNPFNVCNTRGSYCGGGCGGYGTYNGIGCQIGGGTPCNK